MLTNRRSALRRATAQAFLALAAGLAQPIVAQSTAGPHYYNPVWSPDGRLLAFESDRDGKGSVYVVNGDGTGLRKLTPDGVGDAQPSWSPDGRQLVVTSSQSGPGHLWLTNADGTGRRRLTSDSTRLDFYASFSPDGQWIVLGAQDARNRWNYFVAVVAIDRTRRRELTDTTFVSEGPRWTTDGSRVVFSRYPNLAPKPGESGREYGDRVNRLRETVSVRPDGSERRVGREAEADLTRVHDPALSPDGRWMADGKTVNGVSGIYVREAAGGRERLVISGPGTRRP